MRTTNLIEIRPEIEIHDPKSQSKEESFQNDTLRPILKLQHPISLRLLLDNKNFAKMLSQYHTQAQLNDGLSNFLFTNKAFRSQIIGCVVGMLTMEEYEVYRTNTKEYNKRILSMQIKRYTDSIALSSK